MTMKFAIRQLRLSNLSFFREIDQAAAAGNERGININRPVMDDWFGRPAVDANAGRDQPFVIRDHWLDGSNVNSVTEQKREINLQGAGKNWRLEGGMVRGLHYRTIRENDYMVMCFNLLTDSLGWVIVRGDGVNPVALGARIIPPTELSLFTQIRSLVNTGDFTPASKSMWIIAPAKAHALWNSVAAVYPSAKQIYNEVHADSADAQAAILIAQDARGAVVPETTYKALIDARKGQGRYRQLLIDRWSSCALTGVAHPSLLRASHLKPWRPSTNVERINVDNGLLLAATMDAALDRGLIAFTDTGDLLISPQLSAADRSLLQLDAYPRLRICPPTIVPFLKIHRDTRFLESLDR